MKTLQEVDDMYLSRLLSTVLEFYDLHKEYPDIMYLQQSEYDWVREKFNVLDHITLGHIVVGIFPDCLQPIQK